MNDKEYIALAAKVEQGKQLPLVDKFLFEMETKHREAKPNPLQQQAIDRQKNPLLPGK
jgi:hypothetical protein